MLSHQLCVGTVFHNTAALKDKNAICVSNGAQSMSDSDGGSALGGSIESLLNGYLGCRVETRCRLVDAAAGAIPSALLTM